MEMPNAEMSISDETPKSNYINVITYQTSQGLDWVFSSLSHYSLLATPEKSKIQSKYTVYSVSEILTLPFWPETSRFQQTFPTSHFCLIFSQFLV